MKYFLVLLTLSLFGCSTFNQKVTFLDGPNPSGELVSVSYSFPQVLTQGDKFEIYVGNEKAARFTLVDDFTLGKISTRVRVEKPSVITGKITWYLNSKPPETLEYSVDSIRAFKMPDKCDTTSEHKIRRKGQEYKILFNNHMSKNCYIDSIEFESSEGKLLVELSSKMTRNPYFHLVGVKGASDLKVKSSVHTK
ncbi:MAG: hypothetical protein GY820_47955 [Gammaproteobacteria bacterium]|nr:hypothetical protein [Gammaproteobacteria bacterium]